MEDPAIAAGPSPLTLPCGLLATDTLRFERGHRLQAVHVFTSQDGAQHHHGLTLEAARVLRDWLTVALDNAP